MAYRDDYTGMAFHNLVPSYSDFDSHMAYKDDFVASCLDFQDVVYLDLEVAYLDFEVGLESCSLVENCNSVRDP